MIIYRERLSSIEPIIGCSAWIDNGCEPIVVHVFVHTVIGTPLYNTYTTLFSQHSAYVDMATHFVCLICFTLYVKCEKCDAILNNQLDKHGCVHEFEDPDSGVEDEETVFNCLTGCKLVAI